ncbi:LysR family transcriptional regulator [Variovorax sp. S2]|uniref:LysR family transcriptional regulator n=1 Tax=Variovorax sp. S12S4 TaxID=3029170 RepID=UPI00215C15AB|nr:LysR family transcriptional regulator [Variovorax sp. S12S4]MCR8960288.1 LysR family transcriptional regulator [Variovorax sp. S12S4]
MSHGIQPSELGFFVQIATGGSLSAAARNLGVSTPAVSKRLSQMEQRLRMPLVNRTTRRMSLTPEGEVFLEHARRILGELDDLDQLLAKGRGSPKGLLRVNATLGFGRMHVAPVISRYSRLCPDVEVQLQLSADPPPLTDDAFDVCVRFGEPPDARVIAKRLAPNRRLLCASPKYLAQRGMPVVPSDLARHDCIGIRQGNDAYGVWRLSSGKGRREQTETIKVRGALTTNDGEIAVRWALDGHGIVMRAEWDIERYLAGGRLVQVLPQYRTPGADIYAVYAQRHQLSSRIRVFVDCLSDAFARLGNKSDPGSAGIA